MQRLKAQIAKNQVAEKRAHAVEGINLPPKSAMLIQRRHTMPPTSQKKFAEIHRRSELRTIGSLNRHSSQNLESNAKEDAGVSLDDKEDLSPALSSSRDVDIGAVSRTLAALMLLKRANDTQRALLPSAASRSDTESSEHAMISVADDGRSGVAATAAAAVSVALAQSWAAVAGGKSTIETLEDVDASIPSERSGVRARFKLVAAVPRNVRSKKPTNEAATHSPRHPDNDSSPKPNENGKPGGSHGSGGMKSSYSAQSLYRDGDVGMALESLEDAQVLNDKQEATWRASGCHLKLQWLSAPKIVLVVFKPSREVFDVLGKALAWLLNHKLVVYVEPAAYLEAYDAAFSALKDEGDCAATNNVVGNEEMNDSKQSASRNGLPRRLFSGTGGDVEMVGKDEESSAEGILHNFLRSWDSKEMACADGIPKAVAQRLDLVITLGGDGTVLWACSLFGRDAVPPVVPLAMGSLGFMTPFPINRMEAVLARVTSVAAGFSLMLRHRLQCRIIRDGEPFSESCIPSNLDALDQAPCGEDVLVLNEIVIDRGMTASLANLQCFVDQNFVTSIQGDGLIVSTPTGSTAYNLAAGGSMVHPAVPCILFTPVCPHSLSSRPVVFPEHVTLRVKVPSDSRSEAYCSFDGRTRRALYPGDSVLIQLSQRPVPVVCNRDSTHDWFLSVREGLHWNKRVSQKPILKKKMSVSTDS